ncbi:hypothetical protein mflW37_0770 [Mesoplasma florum W37]|uniref:Uncharacterized protein n=1 Tax=Mesoplasma florum TaxID=2151 RepID=A0AAD2PSI1_MESFO|nr:hypothetical protein [Mesoplasma florum]AGY41144.1 hypothetical protein mflW37_0770 [Mesoplasma florum W37]AVN59375.1 hypothetical protein CG008_00385 [Mesoplasma florum]AVN65482.1 hypothetical protein MflW12_0770 [Mesoplasma florum]
MKINTWTFYDAKDLVDVQMNPLLSGDIVFLVLRPDINQPNRLLGFGLPKDKSGTVIVDLQNKELSHDDIYAIFKGNLGITQSTNLKEIEISGTNLSSAIRLENIQKIIEVYNVFFKTESVQFDTNDYSTEEDLGRPDIFTELDFNKIALPNILQSLQAGMTEYNKQMEFLQSTEMPDDERKDWIVSLSILQSNLILFFDNALRKLNNVVVEQQEELNKLKNSKN